jgi:hypothetical protein
MFPLAPNHIGISYKIPWLPTISSIFLRLLKCIPFLEPNVTKMVNVHFFNDSFLIILEDKELINNTMDCSYILNWALGSKIQMVKTQCYRLMQDVFMIA